MVALAQAEKRARRRATGTMVEDEVNEAKAETDKEDGHRREELLVEGGSPALVAVITLLLRRRQHLHHLRLGRRSTFFLLTYPRISHLFDRNHNAMDTKTAKMLAVLQEKKARAKARHEQISVIACTPLQTKC